MSVKAPSIVTAILDLALTCTTRSANERMVINTVESVALHTHLAGEERAWQGREPKNAGLNHDQNDDVDIQANPVAMGFVGACGDRHCGSADKMGGHTSV